MQTFRLVIGPDGTVKIPGGEPGRAVTVLLDESFSSVPSEPVKPVAAMTLAERAQLKEEFLARGRSIQARFPDRSPSDHGTELYGDDGLPR
jgi:hypothetical protein